jgi:hypothetical protein
MEKMVISNLRYYADICQEGLRKTIKMLIQDNKPTGQDSTLELPRYKAAVLVTYL